MEVVVTGIGLISALGDRVTTWKRLLAGETGIATHQPFSDLAPRPLALIHHAPSDLIALTQQVIESALLDADLTLPLPNCGVVVGSSRANQARWEQLAVHRHLLKSNSSGPLDWLSTLPNAAAIAVARHIQTTASVLAPMSACATGLWAIAQAYELLQTGQCQQVIAGAIEVPITPLTLTGFDQMGALAKTGAYPFDADREGLVLGEGGALLVLESAKSAERRRARIYGRLLGFGLTADGYHVSAPHPQSRSAIVAVQQCLQRSQLTSTQIDYIHAHGTATQLNDRMEATVIQQVFAHGVPVSSTKGATGHTIGASGALGAAFCLLALQDQCLPPCVGLTRPEFDLKFVKAAHPVTVQNVLCLSFGFGGQNAAIAFSR